MKTHSLAIAWSTGIAIFSMFFGSGNVVFPLLLGEVTGNQLPYALVGLMLTAVGAPLLGLLGCVLFAGDCKQFFYRIGVVPGYIAVLLILGILGPFGVLPRCFIVAYGAVQPYFPELSLFWFSILAGILTLVSIAKRNLILPLLGLVLSPALLIMLVIIIVVAIFTGDSLPATSYTAVSAFQKGLLVGYDTLDLLAAIFFAVSIWLLLKEKLNIQNEGEAYSELLSIYWKASLIGGIFLGLIYVGLSLSAAYHPDALLNSAAEQVLPNLSIYVLGPTLAILANVAIFLACITTVMSLIVAVGDVIHVEIEHTAIEKKIPYSYNKMIIFLMILTIIFSNLGFAGIMKILGPIVSVCYPAIIVLTICNILYKLYGFKWVKVPVYATLVITLGLKAMPVHAGTPSLIEMTVEGSQDAPFFTPENIQMQVGQEYLLVIDNAQDYSVFFNYNKLGQSVFTHYLQGTNGVSQNGFTINGKSKVLWHIQVSDAGEFIYFASNPGVNKHGKEGKVVVTKLAEAAKPAAEDQNTLAEGMEKSKAVTAPAKKKTRSERI